MSNARFRVRQIRGKEFRTANLLIWRQTPRKSKRKDAAGRALGSDFNMSISGLVVEYIVAIDVTRVRFPADAMRCSPMGAATVRLLLSLRGCTSE